MRVELKKPDNLTMITDLAKFCAKHLDVFPETYMIDIMKMSESELYEEWRKYGSPMDSEFVKHVSVIDISNPYEKAKSEFLDFR
jgi:hypothetical protein